MKRYNSCTFDELDSTLKRHPSLKRLSQNERKNLYNLAQELIWNNKSRTSFTYGITITNNVLQDDIDRTTLYTIDNNNLSELRLSLFTLNHFLKLAVRTKYLKSLSEVQKIFIFNLAQQSISDYRNKYDDKEYILSTASFDNTEPREKPINIFLDCYPELSTTIIATREKTLGSFADCYPTVTIKGLESNTLSSYMDCYPIVVVEVQDANASDCYLDCYPTLTLAGDESFSKILSSYFDCYATVTVPTLTSELISGYLDCYPALTVA